MTQTASEITALYDRLSKIGFPKQFVKSKALPDWWDTEFEATAGAAVEAASYLARRLNLDIASLLKPDATPTFKPSCQAKFKLKEGTEAEQLQVAQCMATRVAEMVAYACKPEFKGLLTTAKDVRDEILEFSAEYTTTLHSNNIRQNQPFVNLEGLLNFCWKYGIPVIHFAGFPNKVKKFEGLAAFFYGRPVIVLSFKHSSPARLLFILAHELGHIIKGHLNGGSIVDEEIELQEGDTEEIEANEFAVELLLGKPDMTYYKIQNFSGEELAGYSQAISERDRVDPGVVALNYAWIKAQRTNNKEKKGIIWATAQKALKIIEGDVKASIQINDYIRKYLDFERLDIDSQDYLEAVIAR